MELLLQFFVWIPLLVFLLVAFVHHSKESLLYKITVSATGIYTLLLLVLATLWGVNNSPALHLKLLILYATDSVEIVLDFYFDWITLAFALVGSILMLLLLVFSRYYLHRDEGYKRFFTTLQFFFLSYSILVFSGNYETLFIGWEFIGICSFLLIGFYRDRYLPVKNSLKVLSVFRLGDISLILVMWMSHHLWHQNITFAQLNDFSLVQQHFSENGAYTVLVSFMIVLAAIIKSAQFPFSSWLPRAMEGPTTSSAIFYGSLSIHIGVFLLLRTYPYWQYSITIQSSVISVGLLTSLIGISIAKVQASVKAQIAYSSVAQIGLMFIEVALGWHTIALFHFAGNAFLRTYQLLVSPSVMSYTIHEMLFSFTPKVPKTQSLLSQRIYNTIYVLSIKEWNMDSFQRFWLWEPFKWLGSRIQVFSFKTTVILQFILHIIALTLTLSNNKQSPAAELISPVYSIIAFFYIVKALSERENAIHAWVSLTGALLLLMFSVTILIPEFTIIQIYIYLSGIIVSFITGMYCLYQIKKLDNDTSLHYYHGHTYNNKKLGFVFLLSCLGLVGLPFTPSFIGIDVMLSHIHMHNTIQIVFLALSFMIIEISALRIYSRLFTGMHKHTYHAMAYRSS